MPPALDRLLASPSALRLLRSLVNAPELPATCSNAVKCCSQPASRRHYASDLKNSTGQKWRRWHDGSEDVTNRESIRQSLERELDILEDSLPSKRTSKDPAARWARTLARRERFHGLQGVKAIWSSRQHSGFRLPTDETPDAQYLWGTFIKHPELVIPVINYAKDLKKQHGAVYPNLYLLIMSYWLPRDPAVALDYHRELLAKLELKTSPLQTLILSGRSNFGIEAYEMLMKIYRSGTEDNIYDVIVPHFIEKGDIIMARRWHNLCAARYDLPSESIACHPVVQFLTEETSIMNTETKTNSNTRKSNREARKYDQGLLRRLAGRDAAPVRFEDSFCARMFATRTFPPESVIKGLLLVGVNEIGPQAVLAMALRTEPMERLPEIFEELRTAGIALQGCVFSLALEKFAMQQNWHMVRSMLETDQHPDVFGDMEVQRKLLHYYMDRNDQVQVQRTLAILTLFHRDSSEESWNLLLQIHIKRSGPQHITEVLQDMRTRGIMVTPESIIAIKSLLQPRQRTRKPILKSKDGFDDLRFVTRVYMYILEHGMGPVPPLTWREIIRRFGMVGRLRELRRLLLWLLCWYAPRSSTQFSSLSRPPLLKGATEKLRAVYLDQTNYFYFRAGILQQDSKSHPIRELFPASLHQALIVWGFRAGILANARLEQSLLGPTLAKKHYRHRLLRRRILQRTEWTIGLRTVIQLRNLGVHVHRHTIVKALQQQFVVLFGRGHSMKKENRTLEKVNRLPYATYVQEVNKIWGSPLFREPEHFGKGIGLQHMWHPRMRRRMYRKASISLAEVLGPNWQKRSQDIVEQDARAAKDEDGEAALKELQDRFVSQAEGTAPGFDFLSEADDPQEIHARNQRRHS